MDACTTRHSLQNKYALVSCKYTQGMLLLYKSGVLADDDGKFFNDDRNQK